MAFLEARLPSNYLNGGTQSLISIQDCAQGSGSPKSNMNSSIRFGLGIGLNMCKMWPVNKAFTLFYFGLGPCIKPIVSNNPKSNTALCSLIALSQLHTSLLFNIGHLCGLPMGYMGLDMSLSNAIHLSYCSEKLCLVSNYCVTLQESYFRKIGD